MAILAMWFQEADGVGNSKLLMIFIGLVAFALVTQALVTIIFSVKAMKAMKELSATAQEFKTKAMPLIDSAMDIGHTAHQLINDTAPKVRVITDNLLETSTVVKHSAQAFDKTITDANVRTQRQVARVDGMVSAALNTTAEIVDTVNNGIRGPVQKIAAMANQAKATVEGIVNRIKSKGGGSPFDR